MATTAYKMGLAIGYKKGLHETEAYKLGYARGKWRGRVQAEHEFTSAVREAFSAGCRQARFERSVPKIPEDRFVLSVDGDGVHGPFGSMAVAEEYGNRYFPETPRHVIPLQMITPRVHS